MTEVTEETYETCECKYNVNLSKLNGQDKWQKRQVILIQIFGKPLVYIDKNIFLFPQTRVLFALSPFISRANLHTQTKTEAVYSVSECFRDKNNNNKNYYWIIFLFVLDRIFCYGTRDFIRSQYSFSCISKESFFFFYLFQRIWLPFHLFWGWHLTVYRDVMSTLIPDILIPNMNEL